MVGCFAHEGRGIVTPIKKTFYSLSAALVAGTALVAVSPAAPAVAALKCQVGAVKIQGHGAGQAPRSHTQCLVKRGNYVTQPGYWTDAISTGKFQVKLRDRNGATFNMAPGKSANWGTPKAIFAVELR